MGLLNKILRKKQASKDQEAGQQAVGIKIAPSVRETKDRRLSIGSRAVDVLVFPLVTEKSAVAESMNKYSFIVAKWATKDQIAGAVREIYGIKPIKVWTVNVAGRRVRFKGKGGLRQDYKKAVVSLPKGKSIDIHKGV